MQEFYLLLYPDRDSLLLKEGEQAATLLVDLDLIIIHPVLTIPSNVHMFALLSSWLQYRHLGPHTDACRTLILPPSAILQVFDILNWF